MDSNLRKKKIQEIVSSHSLCGQNTSKKDIKDRGYEVIYNIPLSLLVVNEKNGRIESAIQELNKPKKTKMDFSSDEGQKVLSELTWNSNIDKNKKLLEDIKNEGQLRPGAITNDGIIVDGNRRYIALLKLTKKNKEQLLYFRAIIVNPEDSLSDGLLPSYPRQKKIINIESTSLADFSKNQKNFGDAYTNVKFSLMCDMFTINQNINKTLRFGDFKFVNQTTKLNQNGSKNNYELDNYSYPSLFEINNLDEFTINKLDHSFFNSNNAINPLSEDEGKFNSIPAEKIKLDGVFIDLTQVDLRYFERDQEAKEFPLSTINLINNSEGIVAIKAGEMFMAEVIKNNDEDYQKSPWEDCLNNLGYFMQAVLKPNPFQNKGFHYRDSIFIFTKRENNNKIIAAPISSMFDNWKEPLIILSEIITGKKTKLKFKNKLTIDNKKFYSYSHLSVLDNIDSFPPPFDEFTKVKLKDIAISITKVSPSYQTEKAYIKFQEILSKIKEPQKVGQLLRGTSNEFLADTNIENSLVISEGKYFPTVKKSIMKLPALSYHQAASTDFGNPIITPISEAIIEIRNKNINNLPDQKTSWSTFSHYEVVLKKSLKSEYFAIFIKSAIGQLVASSAHRWALIGNKNSRIPCLTKQSVGEMSLIIPSLKTQDQIIDAHRKIQELKSSVDQYDKILDVDPSLILSDTIEKIKEMLNLVGKLSDVERVKLMISKVESDTNEFKQTWRLPMGELKEYQNFKEESNKIQYGVMKVISSYLNANGGELLLGYSEASHQIEGLEGEFNHFNPGKHIKDQKDLFQHKFNETLSNTFDEYFLKFIRPRFVVGNNKIVYFIVCKEADRPCFIKGNKAKNVLGGTFYRRQGDSSDPLEGEELFEYINNHWPEYKK